MIDQPTALERTVFELRAGGITVRTPGPGIDTSADAS